jgi:hypothetical protein
MDASRTTMKKEPGEIMFREHCVPKLPCRTNASAPPAKKATPKKAKSSGKGCRRGGKGVGGAVATVAVVEGEANEVMAAAGNAEVGESYDGKTCHYMCARLGSSAYAAMQADAETGKLDLGQWNAIRECGWIYTTLRRDDGSKLTVRDKRRTWVYTDVNSQLRGLMSGGRVRCVCVRVDSDLHFFLFLRSSSLFPSFSIPPSLPPFPLPRCVEIQPRD